MKNICCSGCKAGGAVSAAGAALLGGMVLAVRGRRKPYIPEVLKQYRYAHRGYHDKPAVPENSMAAFRRALERGWGIEFDVHLLKDGTLAVMHDSELLRCAGAEGILEEMTLPEVRELRLEGTEERVPLFDEVLELFEGKAPLIIELKTYGGNARALAEAVCRRLDSFRGDFCVESFDPRAILWVRRLRPDICRGQLSENFMKEPEGLSLPVRFLCTNLLLNCLSRPDFVAYHYPARKNFFLRVARRLWGLQEVSWTIRSKADLLAAEQEGCIPIFEKFDPEA